MIYLLQGPNSQIFYSIVGNDEAKEYFAIDPVEGTIVLKKSLVDATSSRYTVSLHLVYL